jgi:hypothetical protein
MAYLDMPVNASKFNWTPSTFLNVKHWSMLLKNKKTEVLASRSPAHMRGPEHVEIETFRNRLNFDIICYRIFNIRLVRDNNVGLLGCQQRLIKPINSYSGKKYYR